MTKSKEFLNLVESFVFPKEKRPGQIQLIGVGWHPAKAYGELKPGDTIVYNYGAEGKIVSVTPISDKTVEVEVENKGQIYKVRKGKNTLIGYKENK